MSGRRPHRKSVDPRTGRLYRIIETPHRLGPPPPILRQAHFDNLTLVPASLLPYKEEWRALANAHPAGTTLVVLPPANSRPRRAAEQVVERIRARGGHVVTCTNDAATGHP